MPFTYRFSVPLGAAGLSPTVAIGVAGVYGTPAALSPSKSGGTTYEADVTVDANYTLLVDDGNGNETIETVPPWAVGGGGGSGPSVQQIWDEMVSSLTTAGSVGKLTADTLTAIAAMLENVGGERFTAQALGQAPAGGGGSSPTAQDNADAVWTHEKRTLTGERGRISRD